MIAKQLTALDGVSFTGASIIGRMNEREIYHSLVFASTCYESKETLSGDGCHAGVDKAHPRPSVQPSDVRQKNGNKSVSAHASFT